MAAGEKFEVTDRGRPVARLVPVVADRWEELLRSGWVVLPEDDSDLLAEGPSDFGLAVPRGLCTPGDFIWAQAAERCSAASLRRSSVDRMLASLVPIRSLMPVTSLTAGSH